MFDCLNVVLKHEQRTCYQPNDYTPNCSPDRVPATDRKMIFHICQKLNMVLGLNEQELKWLATLGADLS